MSPDNFKFSWKFERFPENAKSNQCSRWFRSTDFEGTEWRLEINRARDDQRFLSIYLRRNAENSFSIIDFTITIVATDVSFNLSRRTSSRVFKAPDNCYHGFDTFITIDKVLANSNLYLSQGTLTIQCCIVQKRDIGYLVEERVQIPKQYAAADKYEILPLKEQCSTLLKNSLSEVNVFDIYALADMHQNENLKAAAQDFAFVYANTVLKSSEWQKFMELNPRLASEIIYNISMKLFD